MFNETRVETKMPVSGRAIIPREPLVHMRESDGRVDKERKRKKRKTFSVYGAREPKNF